MKRQAIPAQDQMWSDYRDRLYRFILNRVNDPATAEDLVQDVLTKAYDKLEGLKEQDKLLTWLYQITRNAIIDHYRQDHHTHGLEEFLVIDEPQEAAESNKELACCVMPFIRQLPPPYQQAITLSEIEGMKLKQVAVQQGVSLSGVKSRVQRGRKMLKQMYLKCCQIERDRRGGVMDMQPKGKCDNC